MLTQPQLDQFHAEGVVHLPGALTPEFAGQCAREMLETLEIDENDPESWRALRLRSGNRAVATSGRPEKTYLYSAYAPELWAAMCQLLGGEDRVIPGKAFRGNGVYSLADPDVLAAPDPARHWQAPLPPGGGWHVDGHESWFRHYLDSPEVALLVLILFRDSSRLGGATWYAPESPALMSRYYASHPAGGQPSPTTIMAQCSDFRVAEGRAGDAFLLHPFMMHSGAPNVLRQPRLMENDNVSLREPLRFDRGNPDKFSPLEHSILGHLGRTNFHFERARQPVSNGQFSPR